MFSLWRLLQSAGALQRRLDDEERIMNELQRDKERYDQQRELLQKVCASQGLKYA